jgi:hypothetical protein
MASSSSSSSIGPLIRLWGISTTQLPPPTATADDLTPLLISILQEAVPFIDGAAPRSGSAPDSRLWKHKSDRSSADSAAKVEVWERTIGEGELARTRAAGESDKRRKAEGETWCARRSVHDDAARQGTASWDEFERCFRLEHAEAEEAFTPTVVATHEALAWDCDGIEVKLEVEEAGETWHGFALKVEEMRHRVGKPLKDRTFPVLQMVASAKGGGEFLVVSIPVPDFGTSAKSRLAREKGAQVGRYVSVERVRRMGDGGQVEWLMATASDAGGILPMWVQNMAMPGVVWKDVPLFIGWIGAERKKRDLVRDGVRAKDPRGEQP